MPKKPKQKHKNKASEVPKEWREQVKAMAVSEEVDEDDVIRYGLNYDFKKARDEAETLTVLKEIRNELKKGNP